VRLDQRHLRTEFAGVYRCRHTGRPTAEFQKFHPKNPDRSSGVADHRTVLHDQSETSSSGPATSEPKHQPDLAVAGTVQATSK
jgi:hypothetical protein